jgi:methylglyoxal synthase
MKVKVNYSPTLNEVNELDLALATTPKGECLIGRSPDSDLVLDSPDVSRIHAKFFVQSGNYYFCDLGSRNGSIINGKLTDKNEPVLLKDKDVIRIGDYVMTMEEIIPVSEQLPETVFRTIDPALFSGWRGNESSKNINVPNQAPEVVSEVPQEISSNSIEELSQSESEVELQELEAAIKELDNIIETPEIVSGEVPASLDEPVSEEATFTQPEDIITPVPEVLSESIADLDDAGVNAATPVAEEATFIQPEDIITPVPEVVSQVPADLDDVGLNVATPVGEEATFLEPQDVSTSEPESVSEVSANVDQQDQENIDSDAEIPQEFTIIQPRSTVIQPSESVSEFAADISVQEEEEVDWDATTLQEFTNVQPRDIISQPSPTVNEVPADVAQILQEFSQDFTNVQPRDIPNQPSEALNEILEPINAETAVDEFRVDIAAVEAPEFVNSFTPEFSHEETISTEDIVIDSGDVVSEPAEEIVSQVPEADIIEGVTAEEQATFIEFSVPEETSEQLSEVSVSEWESATTQEEIIAETRDLETPAYLDFEGATVYEASSAINPDVLEFKEEEIEVVSTPVSEELEDESMPELTSSTSESISQTLEEIFGSENTQTDEIVQEVPVSEPQPMITQKNIVLIAHESKKSELADFVNQHQDFFSQSVTVTWPSISEVLQKQAGITVSQQIPAATSGGYQSINALVNSGDILAVIFLRDFLVPQTGQANEEALLRSCNINQVLLATNIPTAEAIVYYIKHLLEHQ